MPRTKTIKSNPIFEPIPITAPGDIYDLNDHRLLCGDARSPITVSLLMNGLIANMSFNDPPYNVKISGLGGGKTKHRSIGDHTEFKMASGEMSPDEFINFLQQLFTNLVSFSVDGSIHYCFMDWKHIYEISAAGRRTFKELKNVAIWNKDNGGMGTFYRSKHELVFIFKNGTGKHINNFMLGQTGRYRTNVWNYPMVTSFKNPNRHLEAGIHPTVKPIALVSDAILDCSNVGNIILDLCLGSGTTLLSSEMTGRICYAVEIEPKYCDLSVKRWIQLMIKENRYYSVKRNGILLSPEEIQIYLN
jgi:DNA modification methylase